MAQSICEQRRKIREMHSPLGTKPHKGFWEERKNASPRCNGMRTTEDIAVTFPNDNSNNGNPLYQRSYTGWIVFTCIVIAVILGIYLKSGRNNVHTAVNPNRPVATVPMTTGSAIPVASPADKARSMNDD